MVSGKSKYLKHPIQSFAPRLIFLNKKKACQ
jgi:hypothetical protein